VYIWRLPKRGYPKIFHYKLGTSFYLGALVIRQVTDRDAEHREDGRVDNAFAKSANPGAEGQVQCPKKQHRLTMTDLKKAKSWVQNDKFSTINVINCHSMSWYVRGFQSLCLFWSLPLCILVLHSSLLYAFPSGWIRPDKHVQTLIELSRLEDDPNRETKMKRMPRASRLMTIGYVLALRTECLLLETEELSPTHGIWKWNWTLSDTLHFQPSLWQQQGTNPRKWCWCSETWPAKVLDGLSWAPEPINIVYTILDHISPLQFSE
jgi:hypothetical protein